MATVLDIVNEAIIWAKESPITQDEYDNDRTKAAKAASARYTSVKRQVLHSYFWRIAERSIRLEPETITEAAADTLYSITLAGADSYVGDTFRLYKKEDGIYYVAPVFRYTRQFAKPEGLVRIRMMTDCYGDLIDSNVAGNYILSDEPEVYLTYTEDIGEEDINETLQGVIALALSTAIAHWLGQDDLARELNDRFITTWRLAKNADAQQDPSRIFQSTDWIDARVAQSANPYPNLLQ